RLAEGGAVRADYTVQLPREAAEAAAREGSTVILGFRPEALEPAADGEPSLNVTVSVVEELGSDAYLYGQLPGDTDDIVRAADIIARVDPRKVPEKGAQIRLTIRPDELHVFSATSGERLL